ncbi:alpha/beta hydrolase [Maribacter sp. MJ134]|uniref:alpha/beta fold hydrolase n=1 Tax=Maribacter sp. MJ134 TaxID=2496865 RepID=UPI000F81991F|nr:alpha/beta hydrolase [Maribacter sp. MJ134]AZQ59655.1 alpha/beta hydrolase [Maribacter sp. MJ134]
MKTIRRILTLSILLITLCGTAQQYPFEVEVKGKGQPILLFPGFTCTGEVWEATVAALSKDYECHVFTFAGFGEVPVVEKPWFPKIKEGVESYIKNQNLKNVVVLGHSLGGTLGLWLATENDHALSKLIIIDALPATGALMIPNYDSEALAYESPWNKQMLSMEAKAFEAMAEQMASGMTLNKEKQVLVKNWMLKADRETYVYGYTDLLKLDLRADIVKINIPVTILAATEPYGLEMAKSTYAKQYANLEDYDLEFAEGTAHFVMYDNPSWFQEKLFHSLEN